MEDLRTSYNVTNKNKRFGLPKIKLNLRKIGIFLLIILIGSLILYPSLIGSYVGTWMDDLYVSFTANLTMSSADWYTILLTILAFIVFYKLIQWRNTK